MDLGLSDKVAIVTGGASGMGACVGRILAEEGVRVVLADIQAEKGRSTASELQARGGDVRFREANVLVRAQVENLISGTLAELGKLIFSVTLPDPAPAAVNWTRPWKSMIGRWMVTCAVSSIVYRLRCPTWWSGVMAKLST